jgi:uncharacterized protein YggE
MEWKRARSLFAPLALAGLLTAGIATPIAAQESTPVAGGSGVIEVGGTGEAEAEAVGAVLQFILRAQFQPEVEPEADSKFGTTEQPEVTEEQVAAVVDALLAAGVPEEKIGSAIQPSGPYSGMFGYGAGVVTAELDEELLGQIEEIADAAVAAGEESGVIFDPVNVAYAVEDCEALEREALADAVADGQAQAAMLADVLGVELGSLVKASKQATYGGYYGGGPSSTACDLQPSFEDALSLYLSPFDPSKAGEVEVYSQILLTYDIA